MKLLSTTKHINLTQTGVMPLFTVPAGKKLFCFGVLVEGTSGALWGNDAQFQFEVRSSHANFFATGSGEIGAIGVAAWELFSRRDGIVVGPIAAGDGVDINIIQRDSGNGVECTVYLFGVLVKV